MPPPRPPRNSGGWGRGRGYYGGGPGCCGCAAPVMTLAVIAVFALAMLIF